MPLGASGSFEFYNYKLEGDPHIKFYELAASPAVGFFVFDKLAAGLRFTYSGSKQIVDTPRYTYKNRDYQYSSFVRYYILSDQKPFNIVADVSYDFQVQTNVFDGGKSRATGGGFTFAAGPVIFFSPQIALEWGLGFKASKGKNYGIFTSIGFQWHFKK